MPEILEAIVRRRAVKRFESVTIDAEVRDSILNAARLAPSGFNLQPWKLFWVESPEGRAAVARLCMNQQPSVTASALVVAVADIGSLNATTQGQMEWMMKEGAFSEAKVRDYRRSAKIGRILFEPGPFGTFAAIKRAAFGLLNLFRVVGMPPLSREEWFKWATKSSSLACQNIMIAAEALGLNTCPMEGFDRRRLSRYLGLSRRRHEIAMVIGIGKKAEDYEPQPQWRRPLETTVTIL